MKTLFKIFFAYSLVINHSLVFAEDTKEQSCYLKCLEKVKSEYGKSSSAASEQQVLASLQECKASCPVQAEEPPQIYHGQTDEIVPE